MLRHLVVRTFVEARPIKAEWDALAETWGDLFASFDWCATWWRHFRAGRDLHIHIWRDAEHVVAILPLFSETMPLGVMRPRLVRIVGCDHSLTAINMPIDYAYRHPVIASLPDALDAVAPWDILHIGPFRGYVSGCEALAASCRGLPNVAVVIQGTRDGCSTLFQLARDYDAYLQHMPGRERRNVLRCERRLRTLHSVNTQLPSDPRAIQDASELMMRLHQAMWAQRGLNGQFCDWPGLADFLRDILATRAPDALLPTVLVDGVPVGVECGIKFAARVHTLFRGYRDDGDLGDASLGRMLHCLMAQHAIAAGATVIDDGSGAFEYKHRLGGDLVCEQSLTLVRRRTAAHLWFGSALCLARLVQGLLHRRMNRMRTWLHMAPISFRENDIRLRALANLGHRTKLTLFGGHSMVDTVCPKRPAFCPLCSVPACSRSAT